MGIIHKLSRATEKNYCEYIRATRGVSLSPHICSCGVMIRSGSHFPLFKVFGFATTKAKVNYYPATILMSFFLESGKCSITATLAVV